MIYSIIGKNDDGSGEPGSFELGYTSQYEVERNGQTETQEVTSQISIPLDSKDERLGSWYVGFCEPLLDNPPRYSRPIGRAYSGADFYNFYIREGLY